MGAILDFSEIDTSKLAKAFVTPEMMYQYLLANGIEPSKRNIDYCIARIYKFHTDPFSGQKSRWIDEQ